MTITAPTIPGPRARHAHPTPGTTSPRTHNADATIRWALAALADLVVVLPAFSVTSAGVHLDPGWPGGAVIEVTLDHPAAGFRLARSLAAHPDTTSPVPCWHGTWSGCPVVITVTD